MRIVPPFDARPNHGRASTKLLLLYQNQPKAVENPAYTPSFKYHLLLPAAIIIYAQLRTTNVSTQ